MDDEPVIDAVLEVLSEEGVVMPYGANTQYYVSAESRGEERARQLAALRAADNEAETKTREVIRKVLKVISDFDGLR